MKSNQKTHAITGQDQEYMLDLQKQELYIESLKKKGQAAFTLVAVEAFVEGMRDSGYKSTATAIDELIDNSIQAYAKRIDIITEPDPKEESKVAKIAIIDNGHGMQPEMIRAATVWGGTHRFNDRRGLGRFGFGLPSSTVSIARTYKVYSRTRMNPWYVVDIDLKKIAQGQLTDEDGRVTAPNAVKTSLPKFVVEYLSRHSIDLQSGTIIVLEHTDRLSTGYKTIQSFEKNLKEHIGLIYRKMLLLRSAVEGELEIVRGDINLNVNGERVEPIDPLFITPGAKFFKDPNGVFAEDAGKIQFEVETKDGQKGSVRLQFSYMPPNFSPASNNRSLPPRLKIMKENNAYLIVTRSGRQIDLVTKANYENEKDNITLVNFDRNWAIELDFDPVLDEFFGITVNKQQVTISKEMWSRLREQGVPKIVKNLRNKYKIDNLRLKKMPSNEDVKHTERIMALAEKFFPRGRYPSYKKQEEAIFKFEAEVDKLAKELGDYEVAEKQIKQLIESKSYMLALESSIDGPFYRCERVGNQIRLFINKNHHFYSNIYDAPDIPERLQNGIELMLFAFGLCELDADDELEMFYKSERFEWSRKLSTLLTILEQEKPIDDELSAKLEEEEAEDIANSSN